MVILSCKLYHGKKTNLLMGKKKVPDSSSTLTGTVNLIGEAEKML
jgi:hypothetical protein